MAAPHWNSARSGFTGLTGGDGTLNLRAYLQIGSPPFSKGGAGGIFRVALAPNPPGSPFLKGESDLCLFKGGVRLMSHLWTTPEWTCPQVLS